MLRGAAPVNGRAARPTATRMELVSAEELESGRAESKAGDQGRRQDPRETRSRSGALEPAQQTEELESSPDGGWMMDGSHVMENRLGLRRIGSRDTNRSVKGVSVRNAIETGSGWTHSTRRSRQQESCCSFV